MPSISLADIKAAADAKYGPFVVDLGDGKSSTLLSPIRLGADARKELSEVLGSDDQDNVSDRLARAVTLAAATPSDAERLLSAVGDDLAYLAELLAEYGKASQVGEASTSPS